MLGSKPSRFAVIVMPQQFWRRPARRDIETIQCYIFLLHVPTNDERSGCSYARQLTAHYCGLLRGLLWFLCCPHPPPLAARGLSQISAELARRTAAAGRVTADGRTTTTGEGQW